MKSQKIKNTKNCQASENLKVQDQGNLLFCAQSQVPSNDKKSQLKPENSCYLCPEKDQPEMKILNRSNTKGRTPENSLKTVKKQSGELIRCEGCETYIQICMLTQHKIQCSKHSSSSTQQKKKHKKPKNKIEKKEQSLLEEDNQLIQEYIDLNQEVFEVFPQTHRNQQNFGRRNYDRMVQVSGPGIFRPRMIISDTRSNFGSRITQYSNSRIGLKKRQIQTFPRYLYQMSSNNAENICIICYSDYILGQQILSLPCTHFYHCGCIIQWLKNNQKCPVCKQSVRPETKLSNKGGLRN